MSMIEKKKPLSDEEKQVISYLQDNPDFFSRHPGVLETLFLPHNPGAAVSLVEKQLTVLRSRNTELRSRLNDLMERSKANDRLFTKSRDLVLKLIQTEDLAAVIKTLLESFKSDFQIEYSSLSILHSDLDIPGLNILSGEAVMENVSAITGSDNPVCGVLRSQQLIALFGDSARHVGSAVAMPLAIDNQAYGILALGNSDRHYYDTDMDTLFLRFLADILNLVLYPKL